MHEKWTKHLDYLTENVGKKQLSQMAVELGVKQEELRLFLHRSRRFSTDNSENVTIRIITAKFIYPEYFMPTKQFFTAVGIRQRRWWQLYKGERKITEREYRAVCSHLQIDHKIAMQVRQLDIFDTPCTTIK